MIGISQLYSLEVIEEENINIILVVVIEFIIMMDQLILDTYLTGDTCQSRIKRKLYPNDLSLKSRRDEVVEAVVAVAVLVLIPKTKTSLNSYRRK